jgi:hypothetical protein
MHGVLGRFGTGTQVYPWRLCGQGSRGRSTAAGVSYGHIGMITLIIKMAEGLDFFLSPC